MSKDEKRISLRLPNDIHERVAALAKRDERSLNRELIHLLRVAVEAEERRQRDTPTPPA